MTWLPFVAATAAALPVLQERATLGSEIGICSPPAERIEAVFGVAFDTAAPGSQ